MISNNKNEDLAYIQDTEFSTISSYAIKFLLKFLNENSKNKGVLVDLGCGSGNIINALSQHGYETVGIDYSQESIKIAKIKTPSAIFICDSITNAKIPECQYVVSTDITLNYIANIDNVAETLGSLFKKIYSALMANGVFIFDVLITNSSAPAEDRKTFIDQDSWTAFIERTEDREKHTIKRDITLFRKFGDFYRKTQRTDITTSYDLTTILSMLERCGFCVDCFHNYDTFIFPSNHIGLICRKS